MSGATAAVQAGMVAALRAHAGFAGAVTGVFDGPPRRAAYPFAALGEAIAADWGMKGMAGREIRLAVTIHDDGERPARLHALMGQAEEAIAGLGRELGGWRVASCVFLRSRVVRDGDGPWVGLVEHRVRVVAG